MKDKKISLRNEDSLIALHPHQVAEDLLVHLEPFIASDKERAAVRFIATHTLAPPDNKTIARAAVVLFACQLVDRAVLRDLLRVTRRAFADQQIVDCSIVEYPVPFAMHFLYKAGQGLDNDGRLAVETLFRILSNTDFSGKFTGIMFHKHVIAFRDVVKEYWKSFPSLEAHEAVSSAPFDARIKLFARETLKSAVISETTRVKMRQTMDLLDGRLIPGGRSPRGRVLDRAHNILVSEVSPSVEFSLATPVSSFVQSARVDEPCPDDDDSDLRIEHPSSSTPRDRSTTTRHVRNGFARRNVRSTSDMSGCSRVTYTDFLCYAESSSDSPTYAFVWLSGFPGIDIRRPLKLKRTTRQLPKNDEVLVDSVNSTIEYKVLRRKKKNDKKVWESCGLMCLPVPRQVAAGLETIIKTETAKDTIKSVEKLAKKFGRKNAGRTPTPRRLRSSARLYFAPLGFTELKFGAISGLVPPGVRALSHYYHEAVIELQSIFRTTYERAADQWKIDLPELSHVLQKRSGRRNDLFCLPSEPLETVAKSLIAIASAYENDLPGVYGVHQTKDLIQLVRAVNHFSLALYVFQELAVGLRPTGAVAQFAHATSISGSLTGDKGSKAFAERSFSPLPTFHARLLEVASRNHLALTHGLECLGIRMVEREPLSDLACIHTLFEKDGRLVRERLTGQIHRQSLLSIPNVIDLNREHNWLRKSVAQLISGLVPQWQADEFFGHRRCGREPAGHWSTASIVHFEELESLLQGLLAPIVPASLYRAIEL